MVTSLIKQGCSPHAKDEREGKYKQPPLMAASSNGRVEVVKTLLKIKSVVDSIDDKDYLG
jgi:ankyrin repeat protein